MKFACGWHIAYIKYTSVYSYVRCDINYTDVTILHRISMGNERDLTIITMVEYTMYTFTMVTLSTSLTPSLTIRSPFQKPPQQKIFTIFFYIPPDQ